MSGGRGVSSSDPPIDKVDCLHSITSRLHIVKASAGMVCWATESLSNEGDIGLSIGKTPDSGVYVNWNNLPRFYKLVSGEKESFRINRTRATTLFKCSTPCVVCGNSVSQRDRVVAMSQHGGILEPWMHDECIDKFCALTSDINQHTPGIVGDNV